MSGKKFNASDVLESNNDRINQARAHIMATGEDYFFSLCQPQHKLTKRRCLRCHDYFKTTGPGNRVCGKCSRIVVGVLA